MADTEHTEPLLTLAMIVRDEAATLAATLESMASIADEAVLVDTGSRDATSKIAAERGLTVYHFPWQDDFAAARNYAMGLARGRWVLWLDAGETLSLDDARSLRGFLESNADPARAYAMLVQTPPAPGNASGEQVARVRLVPRAAGICYAGRVRESLKPSLAALSIEIEGLPWRIVRGMREHDLELKARRAERNLLLAERAIREEGASAGLLNCLGDGLATLGRHQRARECYEHARNMAEQESSEKLEAYYGLLSALDHAEGDFRSQQLNVCLEALAEFPLDAQLLCAMGGYLQAQGRPDLACRSYETAFRHGQSNPEVWHLIEIEEIAAVCYSLSLQLQQRDEEACRAMQEAVQANPHSQRLRRNLLELLVKVGERTEALRQIDHLGIEPGQCDPLRSAVRGACLAAEKNWIAARAYLKTALTQGCRDVLALRWYTATLLALGEVKSAQTLVEQWLQDQPECVEALQLAQALAGQAASTADIDGDSLPQRRIDAAAGQSEQRPFVAPRITPPRTVHEPPASV